VQFKPTIVADVEKTLGQIEKIVGVSDDHDKVRAARPKPKPPSDSVRRANRLSPITFGCHSQGCEQEAQWWNFYRVI